MVFPVKQRMRVTEHQEIRRDRSAVEISDEDGGISEVEEFIYTSIVSWLCKD